MSNSHSPEYSYVVAAHNSEDVITETWSLLRKHFQSGPVEIVIGENGSTDGTWPTLQALATAVGPADPSLKVLRSEKGLGNALAAGALASRGKSIVFTADDLPFGFSPDPRPTHSWAKSPRLQSGPRHPGSTVQRGLADVLSTGFRLIRDAVLHLESAIRREHSSSTEISLAPCAGVSGDGVFVDNRVHFRSQDSGDFPSKKSRYT